MADYLDQDHRSPFQPRPTSRNPTGKPFCSNFLFRLLLIALFLCTIPLFTTSEAPDFISHTVFAKSWELVHLFVIGIVVSYGLFGRRRAQSQMGIQSPPGFNSPNMLHASTIFNFEHQNPSGCSGYGNGFGNEGVNQAFEFRPYGVEPTVVVRPGAHDDFDYEPLDLPVRSLRSMVEESDSEGFAPESEIDADASSNCRYSEEDNESENLEGNSTLVGSSSSPSPWHWPNSAQSCYLSSPSVAHTEAKQPSLSVQSSPLCASSSELASMDVEVESSWSGPRREEDVLNSQSLMADLKEEVSDGFFVREVQEVKHVKTRIFRVSSSKGSSPFSPSLSESPPMEMESFSKMENVDIKLATSPTSSLKSRSMRVDAKEKVGDVSLPVGDVSLPVGDTQCQNLPHSQVSSSGFSPLCSVASRSPTTEAEIVQMDSRRSPKSVPPMCNFILPSAVSETPPTIEMEKLRTETKKVETLSSEVSEDQHAFSPPIQDSSDVPLKRVGSRSRRSRKRNGVKGEMKSRTDSLRSESSSCDAKSSPSPPTSSQHLTSTIEAKQSPEIGLSKEVVIKPSKNDFVMATETSRIQSSSSSSSNKGTTSSSSPSPSSQHPTSTIEPNQSPEIGLPKLKSPEVEINACNDFVLVTGSSGIQLGSSSSSTQDERKTLSRTSHPRRFSIGSLFDREKPKEMAKKAKDENGSSSNNSGKCGWDCLKLDVKPILSKNSLRGKSVRTVRPQAITLEPSCTNENSRKQKADQRAQERQDVVIISIGISEKKKGRNQNVSSTKSERGESSSLELGKNKEGSSSSSVVEDVNEEEECNSEIDRKADEFIAKFKQQIRSQKVASRRESSKH